MITLDLLLKIPLIGWMAGFLNCYTYYSQTDYNRIKFKSWTIISFLSMLVIIINTIKFNLCSDPTECLYFRHAIELCDIVIYIFYSHFIFTTNYSLDEKNYKIKRYVDIFLEITVYFIILLTHLLDIVYLNGIALLIMLIISSRKKMKYMCYITTFYIFIEFSKYFFVYNGIAQMIIFIICNIGICLVALNHMNNLKKIEMQKMKTIKHI